VKLASNEITWRFAKRRAIQRKQRQLRTSLLDVASRCYSRSSRPPAVRAHSRQNSAHDKILFAERLATNVTPRALHRRKCQQFSLEHSQIPIARARAEAFISALNASRVLRRRSGPLRATASGSFAEGSAPSGNDRLLTSPILPARSLVTRVLHIFFTTKRNSPRRLRRLGNLGEFLLRSRLQQITSMSPVGRPALEWRHG
jgi:hypothetical protein